MIRFVAIVLFTFANTVSACSCNEIDWVKAMQSHKHVLMVDVFNVEIVEKGSDDVTFSSGLRRAYFDTIKTLKGNSGAIPYIESSDKAPCCICLASVKQRQYLLFSNEEGKPALLAGCGNNTVVNQDIKYVIEALEKLKEPSLIRNYRGYVIGPSFQGDYYEEIHSAPVTLRNIETWRILLAGEYKFKGIELSDGSIFAVELIESVKMNDEQSAKLYHKLITKSESWE